MNAQNTLINQQSGYKLKDHACIKGVGGGGKTPPPPHKLNFHSTEPKHFYWLSAWFFNWTYCNHSAITARMHNLKSWTFLGEHAPDWPFLSRFGPPEDKESPPTSSHGHEHADTHTHTLTHPVEGNGHFFPSYRQLCLSSFFDTHTHTHTHTKIMKLAIIIQTSVLDYAVTMDAVHAAEHQNFSLGSTSRICKLTETTLWCLTEWFKAADNLKHKKIIQLFTW